ncbi:hypothetical protein Daura_23995 [Dactylosporangium aurantiacum]|uniref:Uncharacterized protein n=1 Tax=Dactylosporangium aurantiacum TaxID=35754 RepID=A0A9Q9INK0_9ACTN|nr:hypothetical protein [Dactylosporangium aurantiacum]MDG6103846.1 hypothetical protein [Dactylosporangium aurantiacum]UWZ58956.1 hypothetical protein Daura_23995 [Dactylosporangium aurantiacum]
MSAPRARKRPPTADRHRYDSAYVVVALAVPGGGPDDVAPPLVFRVQRRPQGGQR